jgi:hypothetical protein
MEIRLGRQARRRLSSGRQIACQLRDKLRFNLSVHEKALPWRFRCTGVRSALAFAGKAERGRLVRRLARVFLARQLHARRLYVV